MWFGLRIDNLAKSTIVVAATFHASLKPPEASRALTIRSAMRLALLGSG
jgi:hypothetical protein